LFSSSAPRPGPGKGQGEGPRPAHRPAPPKSDLEMMQGNWKVVEVNANGKHAPGEVSTNQRWRITPDGITVEDGDGDKARITYRLDASQRPRTIDLTFITPPWRGTTFHGIYQLDGNRLKICYTRAVRQRPPDFRTDREDDRGRLLLVLEREQPPA